MKFITLLLYISYIDSCLNVIQLPHELVKLQKLEIL